MREGDSLPPATRRTAVDKSTDDTTTTTTVAMPGDGAAPRDATPTTAHAAAGSPAAPSSVEPDPTTGAAGPGKARDARRREGADQPAMLIRSVSGAGIGFPNRYATRASTSKLGW